jgi:hypothetical protein
MTSTTMAIATCALLIAAQSAALGTERNVDVSDDFINAASAPAVGAIRWDAWYGDIDPVGRYVQQALAPAKWRYRLPFFAVEDGPLTVRINGNTSAVMEQELAYAEQFGIDFWAFVAYPPPSNMFYAQQLYLHVTNVTQNTKVKFCLVMDGNQLQVLERDIPRIVDYFQLPTYQTVLGGRPLVFTFISKDWAAASLAAMVNATTEAGLPAPYIVAMGWGSPMAQMTLAKKLGAQAISQYAFIGSAVNGTGPEVPGHPLSYANNAAQELRHWEDAAAAGAEVLPCITAGWDPRPREVHAPPWSNGAASPGCNVSGRALCYVHDPTMSELTVQTRRVTDWVRASPGAAKANAVLFSAWNEHDEGHWICPSLQNGTQKLEAIQAGLTEAPISVE